MAPWQPWLALAFFGFLLNFSWELLQVPFYRGMAEASHWPATLSCLRAAAGDVVLLSAAYGLVALRAGRRWLVTPTPERVGLFLLAGLLSAGIVELASVHVWSRWAYAPAMPVVLGMGLAPLLQWVLLPPLALLLVRRHLS